MSNSDFTEAAVWGGRPVARRVADTGPRERVVVTGVIEATHVVKVDGGVSFSCRLDDGSGELDLLFLGREAVPGLVSGAHCTIEGTARMDAGHLVIWNPRYRLEPSDDQQSHYRECTDDD